MRIIEYDKIDTWEPWITDAISEIAPLDLKKTIKREKPEYIEDAADIVYRLIGRDKLVEQLYAKLKKYKVRVYHGTRLAEHELERVRTEGLRPLRLKDRKETLISMLQSMKIGQK